MKTTLVCLALILSLPVGVVSAATNSWSFETHAVGTLSGADTLVYNNTGGNLVEVSSSATPFGAGNRSLYVYRPSTASSSPSAQLTLASAPIAAGTVTFDIYVVGTGTTPGLIEINLGALSSGSSSKRGDSVAALQIWSNSETTTDSGASPAGRFLAFSGGTSGSTNLYDFNQKVTISAKNTISISWDVNAATYSVLLNGVEVTRGAGASVVSSFGVTTTQAGVSDIRFTAINSQNTSYYIDNLSITASPIPEPGSMALWLGGAAGLSVACMRRSTRL